MAVSISPAFITRTATLCRRSRYPASAPNRSSSSSAASRARHFGARRDEIANLGLGRGAPLEDRIAERLHEGRDELRVLARGEGLEVEVGDLGETDEEVGAHRAPVVLHEVQVARGHAKALREGRLSQALPSPQHPDPLSA